MTFVNSNTRSCPAVDEAEVSQPALSLFKGSAAFHKTTTAAHFWSRCSVFIDRDRDSSMYTHTLTSSHSARYMRQKSLMCHRSCRCSKSCLWSWLIEQTWQQNAKQAAHGTWTCHCVVIGNLEAHVPQISQTGCEILPVTLQVAFTLPPSRLPQSSWLLITVVFDQVSLYLCMEHESLCALWSHVVCLWSAPLCPCFFVPVSHVSWLAHIIAPKFSRQWLANIWLKANEPHPT